MLNILETGFISQSHSIVLWAFIKKVNHCLFKSQKKTIHLSEAKVNFSFFKIRLQGFFFLHEVCLHHKQWNCFWLARSTQCPLVLGWSDAADASLSHDYFYAIQTTKSQWGDAQTSARSCWGWLFVCSAGGTLGTGEEKLLLSRRGCMVVHWEREFLRGYSNICWILFRLLRSASLYLLRDTNRVKVNLPHTCKL